MDITEIIKLLSTLFSNKNEYYSSQNSNSESTMQPENPSNMQNFNSSYWSLPNYEWKEPNKQPTPSSSTDFTNSTPQKNNEPQSSILNLLNQIDIEKVIPLILKLLPNKNSNSQQSNQEKKDDKASFHNDTFENKFVKTDDYNY